LLRVRKIIAFQGRAGDRFAGNIAGAACLSKALADHLGLELQFIGLPRPPKRDDWSDALQAARTELVVLAGEVRTEVREGYAPFCILPTDASSPAVHAAALDGDRATTLAWFDAHTDFNMPETTRSGFLGGMALAASCGLWDAGFGAATDPQRVISVGARAIEPAEEALLASHRVRRIGASRNVVASLAAEALMPRTFVHLDLDCLEPGHVPVEYGEPDGLLPAEVRSCMAGISARSQVIGLSISEFFKTPELAVDDAVSCVADIISPLIGKV